MKQCYICHKKVEDDRNEACDDCEEKLAESDIIKEDLMD